MPVMADPAISAQPAGQRRSTTFGTPYEDRRLLGLSRLTSSLTHRPYPWPNPSIGDYVLLAARLRMTFGGAATPLWMSAPLHRPIHTGSDMSTPVPRIGEWNP